MTQIEQWIREEGREETAINALREGLDPEFVAKITGLSKEEVLKLKKKAL